MRQVENGRKSKKQKDIYNVKRKDGGPLSHLGSLNIVISLSLITAAQLRSLWLPIPFLSPCQQQPLGTRLSSTGLSELASGGKKKK